MSNKYNAINCENAKYYKGVPYIVKKEFRKNKNNNIVGETRLRKYKSDFDKKNIDMLYFDNDKYEVKNKIFAFNKGYVFVGDNNYIVLKKHIPFLFFLLLFILIILSMFLYNRNIPSNITSIKEPEIEVMPDDKELVEDVKKSEEHLNIYVPNKKKTEKANEIKYFITFDSNEGIGTMENISCNGNELCKLPKNSFVREGYDFIGWSLSKNKEEIYLDETEIFNLVTEDNSTVILYAIWEVKTFDIEFIDYDGSTIKKFKYNYGDKINIPETPERLGYTFLNWDKNINEVKENLIFTALYEIDNYEITYNLNGGIFNGDAPLSYTVEDKSYNIPSPTKKGYTFIGWTSNKEKEPKIDYKLEQGMTGNLKLTANYKPNSYKLIYNTNGADEKTKSKEINFDDTYGELPTVSKKGYIFINWVDKDGKEVSSCNVFNEESDIIINANWNIVNYEIAYDLNAGIIADNPTTYDVEKSIILPNPTKEGYNFVGWTTKDNNTPIINYEIKKGSIGNLKLIANYEPISYNIVYNSSLGEGLMKNTKAIYNNIIKLRKNKFIKEGYNFIGWATTPNGNVVYNDEQEIYNLSKKDNDTINLYAIWDVVKLDVIYYDLFGVVLKEEQVDYGSLSTPPDDPFIDGYTFIGWDSISEPIKSNTDYHAKYVKDEYVIKYDLNSGKDNDLKTINYDIESDDFTLPHPTRTGYSFLGWTGDNGYKPKLQITIPKGSIGNKSYKANWIANVYNISLNSNGGTVNPNSIDISYNSLYGIIPTPIKKGYTFEGWHYKDLLIEEDTVMNSSFNHEITANWKVIDYTINYNLNGGILSSPVLKYNIETETFTLSNPTRTGYIFLGWTGENGAIPSTEVKIEKGSIGDKTYIANWKAIDYSINYDLNGGSISSQQLSYNVETDTFVLPIPTKEGYTFAGWTGTELSSLSKSVTIKKGSIGNRNYTANWTINYYTVNYYVQGSLWTTRSVAYNKTPENLNAQNILDIYHKFNYWDGWVDKMPTKTVNLYANITESYCMLMTGHGPYGNAKALLNVFNNAGWTGRIEEAPSAPGNYWVVTDYTLTREQADIQRDYIANHTNYKNYNFPYLYWVGLSCTNGIGDTWTRSVGTKKFTSQW